MSQRFARFTIAATVFLTAASANSGDTIHLALSGLHLSADEAREGSDWWGLFPDGEGYTLQPVRVSVEAVVNPLADGDTRKTATLITVPGKVDDIPLIRGLNAAVAGPVVSLKPSKRWAFLPPGETIELPLERDVAGGELRIVASGNEAVRKSGPSDVTDISDYQLRLVGGSGGEARTQVLASLPEFFRFSQDRGPELLWAGDLDGDGKLDLLYNLSTFYMDTELALFLSSAAKQGEFVGLVARWNATSGC